MKKYILVTGSSSGIGREIAITLSQSSNIIIHGRDNIRLNTVQSLCNENSEILTWCYDLRDSTNIENSLKDLIKSNNISVSGFVHSAGYMRMLPLKMLNIDTFNETMNINVYAAAMITKVLSSKVINGSVLDSVVFISSNISNFGAKAFSAYGASKSALDGLMRCLAVELAPNVRVNSILPGGVRTAMTESIYNCTEVIERMKAQYPLGLGETSDVSNAVTFLMSKQARWITGQQLTVDGGRSINISG